jgi:hypothetical protein
MVASVSSMSLALSLMPQSGGFDYTALYAGSSSGGTQLYNIANMDVALQQAEKNEAKQLEQVGKQVDVQRDLARYAKVVANAKTVEEVLDDPIARKVFLTANGLGDQVDAVALAKKALMSNPQDADSVANKMASINGQWLNTVKTYNFELFGVGLLQGPTAIKQVSDDYIAEKRLDMLDEQLPGLGSAILFKELAPSLDTSIKILGSQLGREVITTAFGIPKQLALQSLVAQEKAINQRMDPEKLAKPAYVDQIVRRYLINLNGGSTGLTV